MPIFKQSSSKELIKCTPGEKHALISFISSGIKYPPSPLDPNLMRSNWVLIGCRLSISNLTFCVGVIFLINF